jgi:hypothetical protein
MNVSSKSTIAGPFFAEIEYGAERRNKRIVFEKPKQVSEYPMISTTYKGNK